MMKFLSAHVVTWLMLSLSLGLAPFVPEPHVWGKIRWVAGGAVGMTPMDWFDLLLHGSPWLLLMAGAVLRLADRNRQANQKR